MPLSRDEFSDRFEKVFDFVEGLVRNPERLEGLPSIVKLFEESVPAGTVLFYSTLQQGIETEPAPQHPVHVQLVTEIVRRHGIVVSGRLSLPGVVPASSGSAGINEWSSLPNNAFIPK